MLNAFNIAHFGKGAAHVGTSSPTHSLDPPIFGFSYCRWGIYVQTVGAPSTGTDSATLCGHSSFDGGDYRLHPKGKNNHRQYSESHNSGTASFGPAAG
jgi:hypothetical protein